MAERPGGILLHAASAGSHAVSATSPRPVAAGELRAAAPFVLSGRRGEPASCFHELCRPPELRGYGSAAPAVRHPTELAPFARGDGAAAGSRGARSPPPEASGRVDTGRMGREAQSLVLAAWSLGEDAARRKVFSVGGREDARWVDVVRPLRLARRLGPADAAAGRARLRDRERRGGARRSRRRSRHGPSNRERSGPATAAVVMTPGQVAKTRPRVA